MFQKFDASRILITPCFPVTDEDGFNVVVYAGPVGNGGIAGRFQSLLQSDPIPLTAFLDLAPIRKFKDETASFELRRLSPGGPADTAAFAAGPPSEGSFVFERCRYVHHSSQSPLVIIAYLWVSRFFLFLSSKSQYSYFQ